MTDTAEAPTKTADLTDRGLGTVLFDHNVKIKRAMPMVALCWPKDFLDSDDIEEVEHLANVFEAMYRATPLAYPGEWSCNAPGTVHDGAEKCTPDERPPNHRRDFGCGYERLERAATDEEVAAFRLRFAQLVTAAGGEVYGYEPEPSTDDDDEDDDPRWKKEMACESLNQFLADGVGWMVEITTPVRVRREGSKFVSFSWGYTTTAAFWGPTFNEALDNALASDLFDVED